MWSSYLPPMISSDAALCAIVFKVNAFSIALYADGLASHIYLSHIYLTMREFALLQSGGLDFFLMFLRTMLALVAVCALAVVIFRYLLPRLQLAGTNNNRMVRVVETVAIAPRRSLHVIEVAGRWLLISSSEAGVHMVSELDAEQAASLESEQPKANEFRAPSLATARMNFNDYLTRLTNRKR